MDKSELITEWSLKDLFDESNVEEAERQRKAWVQAADDFVSKWKGREDYLENPEILKEALDDYEEFNANYGSRSNEYYYYWLRNRQDQSDTEIKAKFGKVNDLAIQIINKLSFFKLSISKISEEKQKVFLNAEILRDYKHFLERIFKSAKYYLTENEEKIMKLKSESAYSLWIRMVSEFLSKEEREVVDDKGEHAMKNFSEILSLIADNNKEVRDSATKAFDEILKDNLDVAEAQLNAILQNKKVDDEIRGYELADEEVYIQDDLEREVVNALVEAVCEKNNISKKYYEIKAKLFGVEKLAYNERILDYGSLDKTYSYSEALEIVDRVFLNLDKEFSDQLSKFKSHGQIDVYPAKSKSAGAFCVHFLKSQPTYILLNYGGKLRDLRTLAHELGHAINNELMRKQNSLNFQTPLSTAEIASTFMEDFVLKEVEKGVDETTRLSLLMKNLSDDIGTITRQIYAHLLQQDLHREYRIRGYLSKEEIGKLFRNRMEEYMGDYVEQSESSENWWVYWEHLRRYFYNYQYAFGLLIAKAMQRKVKENPEFIEKVKVFLSTGTSKSPKEIFMEMGIDISKKEFWLEGLQEMEDTLNEIESLAKKLGKI